MRDILIHAIHSQYILNEIIRTDTHEIHFTCKNIRNDSCSRNFNRKPNFNIGIIWHTKAA